MANGQSPLLASLAPFLQQQQSPQLGMAMPQATSPAPPATGGDPLQSSLLQASQLGQQAFSEQLERVRNLADTVSQLQNQQRQMPIPKMGYQPQFQPMTGQGAGGDVKNTLGNIGKALLLGLGSTGPGRAVQGAIYGPGIKRYETQYGEKAKQIEELQKQQQIEEEPLGAAAGLQYRPMMAGASVERANAAKQNAETNAKRQAVQESQGLERVAQGWSRLSLGEQQLEARKWMDQATIRVMQQRVAAGEDENSARIQAQEDIRSALSQNQTGIGRRITNWLGFTPDVQAAAGAQATKPATSKSNASKPAAKGSSKATHIWTPQGLQPVGK